MVRILDKLHEQFASELHIIGHRELLGSRPMWSQPRLFAHRPTHASSCSISSDPSSSMGLERTAAIETRASVST